MCSLGFLLDLTSYQVNLFTNAFLSRATPVAFGQVPLSVASNFVKWEDLTMM